MAEAKAPTANYLPGEDFETLEANRRYQEALAKLTESLDTRKNRFFDPTMLAMAEGFLGPTQTGSFGEALGRVAGKLGPAEAAAAKEQQDIAQQRVAVAGQGIELQRLKSRDAALNEYLNPSAPKPVVGPLSGPQAAPTVTPQAGPLSGGEAPSAPVPAQPAPPVPPALEIAPPAAGPLSQAPAQPAPRPVPPAAPPAPVPSPVRATVVGSPQGALTAMEANKPPGFEGVEGIQFMPPDPNFPTGRDHVRLNRFDRSKSAADLIKEAQEIHLKRFRDKDIGVVDLASGLLYSFPTGKTEEIQLYGYPGTHKVDARTAAKLSMLAARDDPDYHVLAKRIVEGPRKPGAGTEGKPTAPLQSQQQLAIEQREAELRSGKLGEKAAEKEAAIEETDATARRVYGSVTRVQNYLKESKNYFGIFARPGITAAIGNLIKEGIQTPTGSLNLAGFEDSMRLMMPAIKQKDVDNVTKAAAELAEVELAFTRLYLAKQGAVTEGERKIVRAIPGTISSSPEVLRSRMELLKSRSQFDIDTADAFRQWQDKNPGRSYLEFERKSDLYKEIKKEFADETERIFGGIKAVPTSQRRQEAAAAGNPSAGFIRDPKTGVIRRKKEGE